MPALHLVYVHVCGLSRETRTDLVVADQGAETPKQRVILDCLLCPHGALGLAGPGYRVTLLDVRFPPRR
jgi:hypothetical protein